MLKKKLTKVLVLGCAAVLAVGCLALTACGGSGNGDQASGDYKLVKEGTLTVSTSPDYKPMEYMEDGEIRGFDIALIDEIANRLGLQADVQQQAFDTLVTGVAGGTQFDCSISSITIDDERAEQVLFSDPYYDSNLAMVVLADSDFKAKEDLDGMKVAAQSGSSGEAWVKENLPNADYTPFQETPDALAALRAGTVDAVVYDDPVAENHVSGEYDDCKVLEVIPTGEQYGIIFNKDNQALCDAVNQVLKEMTEDGTMDKLKAEYIGETAAQ